MVDKKLTGKYDLEEHFAPYGNASIIEFTGRLKLANADTRAVDDTETLLHLPNGILISRVEVAVTDGAGATTQIDLGTVQLDPVDSEDGGWTDDPDYFLDGANVAGATLIDSLANLRHAPLEIDKDNVWLRLTWKTAVPNNRSVALDFYVYYRSKGQK